MLFCHHSRCLKEFFWQVPALSTVFATSRFLCHHTIAVMPWNAWVTWHCHDVQASRGHLKCRPCWKPCGVLWPACCGLSTILSQQHGTCRFITCFVTMFAVVIAITKDLADVEGDRKYGIQTFSTRLGTRRVTFLGASLPLCVAQCSCLIRTHAADLVKLPQP